MPTPTENTFNYEQATELPVRLPLDANAGELAEIVLAIRTAESLGKAVVIQITEDVDGNEELMFYAIERVNP